ncbi:phosphoesterase [Acidaminobacter sp. JC074]|uniref:DHH family phosphoesterase n=1 Tax=Acidaminobacter sp. JC074 TaxID=2530199 RepID=UPI001F0D20A9|nr:DHH family phosphoesterase [Acidaminobacter sp. JC074]MCH4891065.1 phosphoesterase [Acidaminobacter sp. JC074]
MKSGRKVNKLLAPNTRIYLMILAIFALVIALFHVYLGIIAAIVWVFLVYYNWISNHERSKKWEDYIESLSGEIDSAARYAILNLPFPLTLLNLDGKVTWYNSSFTELFPDTRLLGKDIHDLVSSFSLEKLTSEENGYSDTKLGERYYRIFYNIVEVNKESKDDRFIVMLYWVDITEYTKLKELYSDERSIVAIVQVDNLEDVLKSTKEEKRMFVLSEIDRKVNLWASRMNAVMKKYQKDRYLIVFENKFLENLEAKRFAILDDMREIDLGNKTPVTLSIGVGSLGRNLSKLEEYAFSALELALSRGGDQAVVRMKGDFKFYGGKTKAVEKRNRVKARVIAHGLRPLIDDSPKVFIMGHKYPDMDCFGAAIGMYRAVVNRGKDAYIVLNQVNDAIFSVFELFADNDEYKFIGDEEALEMITDKDLLVVVDTHRPSFTECPPLLEKTDRVVLIDHHRVGTEQIEKVVLRYTEPYASSTCELVSEILQYIDNKQKIDKIEAEAMLAGIAVDTKNFSFKTGVRTFDAASFLRRLGADTTLVKQLFQDDIGTFVAKSNIVSTASMYKDSIAIAVCPKDLSNPQLVAAQGADELLNIRGINASFVIGQKDEDLIFISGRSLGDINVQLIMEKLGGGGHLEVAGAQLTGVTMKEAREKLEAAIDEFFEEEE